MNFGQDTLQVVEIKLDNRKILWSGAPPEREPVMDVSGGAVDSLMSRALTRARAASPRHDRGRPGYAAKLRR